MNINESLIKLFKVFVSENDCGATTSEFIKHGICAISEDGTICESIPQSAWLVAKKHFGLSNIDFSKTFHQSLEKVANTDYEQLVVEQLVHYISTYGTDFSVSPYIPFETLNIDLNASPTQCGFTVIREVTEEEAKQLIKNYFNTVKAPNKSNIDNIKDLLRYLAPTSVDDFVSNEIKVIAYDLLGIIPSDPQAFLRYAIYKRCGLTLLIKNTETIRAIKYGGNNDEIYRLFSKADKVVLAEIFFRYKKLFLAFKVVPGVAPIINAIRRLADTYHKPLSDFVLTNFSTMVKNGQLDRAKKLLEKASLVDVIKLFNFATSIREATTRAFNIRNGKTFILDEVKQYSSDIVNNMLLLTLEALTTSVKDLYVGKKFYIPDYINYACPISEKQFIGNIPWGTSINTPSEAFTAAIYWEDWKDKNVDIDVHLISTSNIFGWNASYRDNTAAKILFSGDMTCSVNGAAEAYYFNKKVDDTYILTATEFSGMPGAEFKFLLTNKKFKSNYSSNTAPVDVKDAILPPIKLSFDETTSTTTLGLFDNEKFYFYGGACGTQRVPDTELYKKYIGSLLNKLNTQLSLTKFIELAGGTVLTSLEDVEDTDIINLDPSVVTSTDLLNLLGLK